MGHGVVQDGAAGAVRFGGTLKTDEYESQSFFLGGENNFGDRGVFRNRSGDGYRVLKDVSGAGVDGTGRGAPWADIVPVGREGTP